MARKPDPKKVDSLGRKRLSAEKYSQAGGWRKARHIVWRCKRCKRAWNVSSKSSRYDAKCRQCGVRNTILLTTPSSFYRGRKRVTTFSYFSTPEDAEFEARRINVNWMKNKLPKNERNTSFVKATFIGNPEGTIDSKGHHYPKTKEMQ